jgi:response regulator RpfG family c-di-GMP phosphodiesterase
MTDWRDHETGSHLQRTKNYSKELAKRLRKNKKHRKIITSRFIKDIFDTAPLHDIGKVGIKDSILLKAGKLTDEEFEEMKKHVLIGKQVIQDIIDKFNIKESFMMTAKNIAASHHEKYNGNGYPQGLKGDAIPLEARIFALADVYDALRSKRPYKDEIPHSEVVGIIRSEGAEHFDPDVVEAFLKCAKKFLEISETYK